MPECLMGFGSLRKALQDVWGAIQDAPRQFTEFWTDPNEGGFAIELATVPLAVPGGGGGAAAKGTVTLYRAVDKLEAADIVATGVLRAVPHSVQGKHFATTAADAATWGERMLGEGYRIVKAEFPASVVNTMHHWDRLDHIGPALFATIDQLKSVMALTFLP